MSEELAIEILKQATIETTIGACEKCPRKDKNKTCIGCLDNAKEQVLLEIERLNNIINKALEKSKGLQYRFGYVLDDLIYLLMQGSDKK